MLTCPACRRIVPVQTASAVFLTGLTHLVTFECVDQLHVAVDVPVSLCCNCRALHHTSKPNKQVSPPTDLHGFKVSDTISNHHHRVVGVALTDLGNGCWLALC